MEEYYFLAFENTVSAMKAEDYLKKNEYNITMMPTPREVSESCGLSIKLNGGNIDNVRDLIDKGHIKVKGIYGMRLENGVRKVERVGI